MATNAGLRPANSSSAASSADADSAERGGHSSKETKRPAPIRSETVATRAAYPARSYARRVPDSLVLRLELELELVRSRRAPSIRGRRLQGVDVVRTPAARHRTGGA